MDSSSLYTTRRRRVRSSRIAYPIFFFTVALLSLAIVAAAQAMGVNGPVNADIVIPLETGGADATAGPESGEAGGQPVSALPSLTPTPLPQFRAEPQSVRADCGRTALHGTVYSGEHGVNDLWIRVWLNQPGGLPREWQALTGSNPAWGNGGYAILLEEHPAAAQWFVAVADDTGSPISEVISLASSDGGCEDGTGQQVFHLNFARTSGDSGSLALLSEPTGTPYPTASPFPTFTPTATFAPPPEPTAAPPLPEAPPPAPAPVRPPLVSDGSGRSVQVPILMYHHVSVPGPGADAITRGLSVGPDVFRAQLVTLREQGFTSVTLTDLAYAIQMGAPLPARPVVITFDDGYRDNYTNAYSILKEEGFVGTFFIFTDPVNERNLDYMTWEMVKEMQEGGMEIGSHTLGHLDLPGHSPERIRRELQESRRLLEERLGVEVRTLAYPYGEYDPGTAHLAREAGYWIAVGTRGGTVHSQNNIMTLKRVRVTGSMFPERLMDILYDHCDVFDECG